MLTPLQRRAMLEYPQFHFHTSTGGNAMTQAAVSNWGRWGADDSIGALNLLTPDVMLKAVKLVTKGKAYSLAVPWSATVTSTFPSTRPGRSPSPPQAPTSASSKTSSPSTPIPAPTSTPSGTPGPKVSSTTATRKSRYSRPVYARSASTR